MCLGIPGRVVEVLERHGGQLALVEVDGVTRRINIGLLDEGRVGPGDWVLIHLGFAMERIDAEQAAQARNGFEQIGVETMRRGADPT